jgi:formylglycine-generating enzyme required for sulfatase activity
MEISRMKKPAFPVVISISFMFLLACQFLAQSPVNGKITPTQPQEAIPTIVPTLAETPSSFATIPEAEMVLVPAGEFIMGNEDDNGISTVYLDAYYIDKYEVTNISYKTCVDVDVCKQPAPIASGQPPSNYGNPDFDNHPVVYVNWYMAKTFCEWRSARLPTEAEWEKSARGIEGLTYPWGNEFNGNSVNFCEKNCLFDWANKEYDDGYIDTAPVGSYEDGKSPYGAYDMAGNVWEWVSSLYKPYPYDASDGRENLDSSLDRVVRGGGWDSAWNDFDNFLRTTFRNRGGANSAFHNYGFRCAKDVNQ